MKLVTSKTRKDPQEKHLGLMVYGLPGCGKTWLCASASTSTNTYPVLHVDYHGQSDSLNHYPNLVDEKFVHIKIETYKELDMIYTWLAGNSPPYPVLDTLFPIRPVTWTVDSLTEIHRMTVLSKSGVDLSNLTGLPDDVGYPRIQDWGKILNQYIILGNQAFKKLGINVVMTALAKTEWNDKEQIESINVAMQGSSSDIFPSTAMSVMYLERAPSNAKDKQGKRVFNVGYFEHPRAFCRDNTGRFPVMVVNPTIPKLLEMLHG